MNFEKLKDAARKYEQKEDWRRAIEVYLKAIQEFESGHDPAPDLSIYNRVGDLYLKANDPGSAVQAYERAADLYREQGFFNNAIALCGKILRVNPGRIQTYLTLAHLHARKNVVIEAKKNLLEYLDRMNALGQLDQAFKAMKDFADQFPGNKEIRLMLSELLRASSRNEEAKEQLEKLASDLEARGDAIGARKTLQRIHAIETGEAGPPIPMPKPSAGKGDLVFLDIGIETSPRPAAPAGPSRKTPPTVRPTAASATKPAPSEPSSPDLESLAKMGGLTGFEIETLRIETSSLAEGPIAIEPVQPVSDEASLELTSFDVGKTLGFEPTIVDSGPETGVAPLEGLEMDAPPPDTVQIDLEPGSLGLDTIDNELTIERGAKRDAHLLDLEPTRLMDEPNLIQPLDEEPELAEDLALDLEGALAEAPTVDADSLGLELVDQEEMPALPPRRASIAKPFLAVEQPKQPALADLEERVFDDPDSPEPHRTLGEALIANGENERGAAELDLAVSAYENQEDWQHAIDVVQELIRLEPNGVAHHQKMVELSYRIGDKGRLIDAYVELGDALMRAGALDKALAVYRRVAEHDPGNRRAVAALEALAPVEEPTPPAPPPAPPARGARPTPSPAPAATSKPAPAPRKPAPEPEGDFVDLGALILENESPRDTRMRVEDEEPTGDEQHDFNEMLAQFKRGIDENIDADDFQSHYDLGVAFKEMGLLDEAIAEFQKALRSPEGRLRASEALGTAFFEKGQYAIAEAILRRAVESLGASDDEQIGLIYWLGRSAEAQGKAAAAIPCYQRVLAVDIGFQDVVARMAKLAAGSKP